MINGKYRGYQRTAADIDAPRPQQEKPEPKIEMLRVKPTRLFLPWEQRIEGAEFGKGEP